MRWVIVLLFGGFASILGYLGWSKLQGSPVPLRENQDAMVLLGACAAGWFLALGGFFTIGSAPDFPKVPDPHTQPQEHAEWLRQQREGDEEERRRWANPKLEGALELRPSRWGAFSAGFFALVLGGAGLALFRYPDVLWTRWIAWPVGVLGILVAVVLLLEMPHHLKKRFRVNEQGIEIAFKGDVKRVMWSEVKAIKDVRKYRKEYKKGWPNYRRLTNHYISLRDAKGEELLKIEYDWEPREQLEKLVEYAPARTKLEIQPEEHTGVL